MAKILTEAERCIVHDRNRENDLYDQWCPILAMLQRDYDEMDVASLWSLVEQQIEHLRQKAGYREVEISIIYNELIDNCRVFSQSGSKNKDRAPEQARRTATTVMCVMLTMLMNAVERGHEEETFANEPICMAIMDIVKDDVYFNNLIKYFLERKTGYDGKEVVITPNDPLLAEKIDELELKQQAIKQVLEYNDQTGKAACAVIVSACRKNWLIKKPTYKEAIRMFGRRWSKDSYKYVNSGQNKLTQTELNLADDRLESALEKLKV